MTGLVIWFTGLPACGKTTMAERVCERLRAAGCAALVLDSDPLRPLLAPERGYQPGERAAFYRRLAELAAHLAGQEQIVLVSATAPMRAHRDVARALSARYAEVFVDVAPDECERRDPKGLYALARAGGAPHLPGAGSPYERPAHPDVVSSGGRDQAAIDAVVRLARSPG